jgi:hypothetical protein
MFHPELANWRLIGETTKSFLDDTLTSTTTIHLPFI